MKPDLFDARILIVDDQQANIDVLLNLLLIKGYTNIRTIVDSREAIDAVKEFKPDILLLDLMMPHVSGFDVMKELQAQGLTGGFMPIMVLTADATNETKREHFQKVPKIF